MVDGTEVVEDGLPGLPFASALIDLFHDEGEGAAEHERRRHGEQPRTHLSGDADLVGAVQQYKSDDDRSDGAQPEANDQHNVRLCWRVSLAIGTPYRRRMRAAYRASRHAVCLGSRVAFDPCSHAQNARPEHRPLIPC